MRMCKVCRSKLNNSIHLLWYDRFISIEPKNGISDFQWHARQIYLFKSQIDFLFVCMHGNGERMENETAMNNHMNR